MPRGPEAPAAVPPALRRLLLVTARAAVVRYLADGERLPPPAGDARLETPSGVFVTLRQEGDLRGCIGHPYAREPLGRAVVSCAIAAAVEDPRFPPLTPAEVAGIRFEISVLSAPRTCRPEDVVVGRDGLIVSAGGRRGLLLPQVASESGWDPETFLGQTCRKAGLPAESWRTGASIECFSAEVFAEDDARPPSGR